MTQDEAIKQHEIWIEEFLRYVGQSHFKCWGGDVFFKVQLSDGSKESFVYSPQRTTRAELIGTILVWMMDRTDDK